MACVLSELSKCKFILNNSSIKNSFAFVQYHRDFILGGNFFFSQFLLQTSICDKSLFQFKKMSCCTGEVVVESLKSSCQCFGSFQFFFSLLFSFFLLFISLFLLCSVLFYLLTSGFSFYRECFGLALHGLANILGWPYLVCALIVSWPS